MTTGNVVYPEGSSLLFTLRPFPNGDQSNKMKIRVVIFGSTGMIGQAVSRECIKSPDVERILLVNRRSSNVEHEKVKELIHSDFFDVSSLAAEFSHYDTCFYCLGVSALGLSEDRYSMITYEMTVSIAEVLIKAQPNFTFCYISGSGTDTSEKGKSMWARVKGKTENRLLSMPFNNAYMFRPGYIQPMKGIRSRTKWYNLMYAVLKPFYFILKRFKRLATDSSTLGKAMIRVALNGFHKHIIETADINFLGRR
jgi:nucleoside-diphosphate-sugar epimerase